MSFVIQKASGEFETFIPEKIEHSLKKIGAPENLIADIIAALKKNGSWIKQSRDIHFFILDYLKAVNRPLAARYNLKKALYEFGPEGFIFEKFVAELFRAQGYAAENDQIIEGNCVKHEIDVIAVKQTDYFLVECKFHNTAGIKTNVKVALYIHSRFEDVKQTKVPFGTQYLLLNRAWLATNTKFTDDAIQYAQCKNMGLIGWAYPQKNSIESLVDQYSLYPITCLFSLPYIIQKQLLEQGILLCKQLSENKEPLLHLGIQQTLAQHIQDECKELVSKNS